MLDISKAPWWIAWPFMIGSGLVSAVGPEVLPNAVLVPILWIGCVFFVAAVVMTVAHFAGKTLSKFDRIGAKSKMSGKHTSASGDDNQGQGKEGADPIQVSARPAAIRVGPNATIDGLIFQNVESDGNHDFIDNSGKMKDVKVINATFVNRSRKD